MVRLKIAAVKFLYLSFLISNLLFGSQADVEKFNTELYGKEKLEVLIQKSKSFLKTSSDQVRLNALDALNIASANHDTSYISLSYCYLGASYVMDKNYDTAYYLLALAEKFALSSSDKEPLVRVYNNIATIHEEIKNYKKSFEYYLKANEVINKYNLDHLYMPQLSLSKFYCRNNNWEKANDLLEIIIDNSYKNNDSYINYLARINQLALLITHNRIDADLAEKEFDILINSMDDNIISKLQTHISEVKLQLLISKNQWDKTLQLIANYQENDIESCKIKIKHYTSIASSYQNNGYPEDALHIFKLIQNLNEKILSLYNDNIELANNDRFELANQKLIIEQINNDKIVEEQKFIKTNTYLNVSLVIIFLLLIILVVIIVKYSSQNYKQLIPKSDEGFNSLSINQFDSLLSEFEYMPAFLLNENLFYEDANELFYKLLNKNSDKSIRGCYDYDLPWKNNSKQLWDNYNTIKRTNRAIILEEDLFICGCDIILLPLIKNNKVRGILGLLKSNIEVTKLNSNEQKKVNQMVGRNDIKNILLVDDEEDNLILIKKYLSKYNCSISICMNGNEALKQLQEKEFQYVLMDLEMPQKNGYETIQEIRNNYDNSNCQYIAVTAHTRNELKEPDIDLFDDIITKPIVKNILVNKLNLSLKDKS